MLRPPLHTPQNRAWHPEGRFVYGAADSGTLKKCKGPNSKCKRTSQAIVSDLTDKKEMSTNPTGTIH